MKQLAGLILAEVILIALIFFGVYSFADALQEYFVSAIEINSAIVVTFLFFIILLLLSLARESVLIFAFEKTLNGSKNKFITKTVKPLKNLIESILSDTIISQNSLNETIDYAVGRSDSMLSSLPSIMITLGLLGTFIGLSATIAEVALLMASLSGGGDASEKVDLLFSGLPKAIEGMKLAFHTSLYGLGASLVSSLALVVYQYTQGDMRAFLRELIQDKGLLEGSSSTKRLDEQLLQTAKILNNQTTIFGDAVKVASNSITSQAKSAQDYFKNLTEYTESLSIVIQSLSTKMVDHVETNNKLDTIAEQLGSLNIVIKRGFLTLGSSFESNSKTMHTTLSLFQVKHQETNDKQEVQDKNQTMIVQYLEKANQHLEKIQISFSKQLIQESVKEQGQFDLFKEEIANVTEQVGMIDLYIKSLENMKHDNRHKTTSSETLSDAIMPIGGIEKRTTSIFNIFKRKL